MARPAVAEFTDRWFDALPAVYRSADEAQDGGADGYPLLRFLSLLGDQAGEVETLVDRIALHDDGTGDWRSDLANPAAADDAWLAWIAQMVGLGLHVGSAAGETFDRLIIDYPTFDDLLADNPTFTAVRHHSAIVSGGESGPELVRSLLLDTVAARLATSTLAWDRLLEPYLTGTKTVTHRRVYGGDPWHLRLETLAEETPQPAVVAAVVNSAPWAAGLVVSYHLRVSGGGYGGAYPGGY